MENIPLLLTIEYPEYFALKELDDGQIVSSENLTLGGYGLVNQRLHGYTTLINTLFFDEKQSGVDGFERRIDPSRELKEKVLDMILGRGPDQEGKIGYDEDMACTPNSK